MPLKQQMMSAMPDSVRGDSFGLRNRESGDIRQLSCCIRKCRILYYRLATPPWN